MCNFGHAPLKYKIVVGRRKQILVCLQSPALLYNAIMTTLSSATVLLDSTISIIIILKRLLVRPLRMYLITSIQACVAQQVHK